MAVRYRNLCKHFTVFLGWLVMSASGAAEPAPPSSLRLTVDHLIPGRGVLHYQLFSAQAASDWSGPVVREGEAPVGTTPVTIGLDKLSPGKYALRVFQDLDDDGQLAMSASGLPKEPVGFSNNPSLLGQAPRLRECLFVVGVGRKQIVIRMRVPPKRAEGILDQE